MILVTTHCSGDGAGYFVKRRFGFGGIWRDLTDTERQELRSNRGVSVRLLVDDTPAFLADILPGDTLLAIDGEPVLNQQGVSNQLRARAGKAVSMAIYRRGNRFEKSVQLQSS